MKKITTRDFMAVWWSVTGSMLLGAIIWLYHNDKEVILLIVGLISGTILGNLFGYYFSASVNDKHQPTDSQTSTLTLEKTNTNETTNNVS